MTDLEERTAEREAFHRMERNEGTRPHGRRTGMDLAAAAIVLSAVALLVSGIALFLQLRRVPEPPDDPERVEEEDRQEEPVAPTLQYRNHILPILEDVPVNEYVKETFGTDESGYLRYANAPIGIDVSSYQGEVDWQQVAEAGVDFVMLRVGYRGYTKGSIMADEMFESNMTGALSAGLDVGVYFFSQAINVWEAEEEADYVLEQIAPYNVTYPVAFDWESVDDADARTKGFGSDEVTRCAGAFCDAVAAAGYTPLIYFNMDQGYLAYRLERLKDYPFWLAEYHDSPEFYYHFDLWQYTHQGDVPGIIGAVDMDLDLRFAGAE